MSKMDYNTLKFAWIDIETTGLEKEGGGILEIACIVTDRFFNEKGRFHTLVHPGEDAIRGITNPVVIEMHTSNGLLRDIQALDTPTTEEADIKFADFLASHNEGNPRNIILAGNSPARIDIPFLEKFAPLSTAQMHYRAFDVTSLRIAVGIHFGHDTDFEKKKTHRAFDDIVECIEEYRYVAAQVFKSRVR